MNVRCSWCNEFIRWAGIEYGVSHSICRRCCREHFPVAAVAMVIGIMGTGRITPRVETEIIVDQFLNK